MTAWKLPPKAKVYEALSALADGRMTLTGDTAAEVLSSARDKTYRVRWSRDGKQITADDNASRWQGYTGYPIIAVLLATGRIPYDAALAPALAGVPWKQINTDFKRDYDAAVESVLERVATAGGDVATIRAEVERIYEALAGLELEKLTGRQPG